MTPFLLGVLIVLFIYYVRARREIKHLKNTAVGCSQIKGSDHFSESLKQFQRAGFAMESVKSLTGNPNDVGIVIYPDKDDDGVPDAFQRRKPLSEMLEFEKESTGHQNDYWMAIRLPARYPEAGEYFIHGNQIKLCTINHAWPKSIIIKAVPGTNLDDLVDLTK